MAAPEVAVAGRHCRRKGHNFTIKREVQRTSQQRSNDGKSRRARALDAGVQLAVGRSVR